MKRLLPSTISCSSSTASLARREALRERFGTDEGSFASLESLLEKYSLNANDFLFALKTNDYPTDAISPDEVEYRTFQGLYVQLEYAKHVWKHSIRVLTLDAASSRAGLGGYWYLAVATTADDRYYKYLSLYI